MTERGKTHSNADAVVEGIVASIVHRIAQVLAVIGEHAHDDDRAQLQDTKDHTQLRTPRHAHRTSSTSLRMTVGRFTRARKLGMAACTALHRMTHHVTERQRVCEKGWKERVS